MSAQETASPKPPNPNSWTNPRQTSSAPPPLWGLRFRHDLMHDGDTPGTEAAIKRHAGEATTVRQHYEHLTPTEKQQLQQFLNSL